MLSKPAIGVVAAVVIAGAAGGYLLSRSGSGATGQPASRASVASPSATGSASPVLADPSAAASGGSSAQSSPASAQTPAISTKEATLALCQVRSRSIQSMLAGAPQAGEYEVLRDAIPALGDRIQEIQLAAQGRPHLQPVLTVTQGIYQDWSEALKLHDGGNDTKAAKALRNASSELDQVDGVVNRVLLSPSSACR